MKGALLSVLSRGAHFRFVFAVFQSWSDKETPIISQGIETIMQTLRRVLVMTLAAIVFASFGYSGPMTSTDLYSYYDLRGQSNFLMHLTGSDKKAGSWLRPAVILSDGNAIVNYGRTTSGP